MNSEEVEAKLAAEVAVCADALLRGAVEDAARSVARLLELCDAHRDHIADSHIRAAAILMEGVLTVSRSTGRHRTEELRALEEQTTLLERVLH